MDFCKFATCSIICGKTHVILLLIKKEAKLRMSLGMTCIIKPI